MALEILWLAHRDPLNPKAGGAERTIYEVCTRLVKKGHNITLFTGGWKGCTRIDDVQGFKIYRIGKNIAPHLALPIFLLKKRYDVVVNDLGHAVPWFSSTILNKDNIVFFRHLHARSLPGQVNPLLAKLITSIEKCYFIFYHNSTFVTESTTSRNDLMNLGIKDCRIVMNPPGVDRGFFHPAAKTTFPTLVYFGGMRRYKRPLECIFLVKSLLNRFDSIKLFVIGSGPEDENMRRITNEMNMQDSVVFTGRISTEKLSKIVASSWLNIHTSVTEGWGLSILEAAAAGTPTLAYDAPGVSDVIENGLNGLKVKDGDREALSEAALSILINPDKWWSSSLEVAKKYSWDRTAKVWESLIKLVLEERS